MIGLENLGYDDRIEKLRSENNLDAFQIGRVIAEHKERYIIRAIKGEYEAEITGNMRYSAASREDFPAVGDWVGFTTYESDLAIIHAILPRSSVIKRKAVGHFGEIQIIAVNIDYAFLIQAVDRDYNINRLERYLTICNSAKVTPAILLSKVDLINEQRIIELIENIRGRIRNISVMAISNATRKGYEDLIQYIKKGKTYCMLGSSGAGKSTLLNNLSGKTIMRTDVISQSTGKGKHVTSHRELFILPNGGIIIDNPGMREVGIADTETGLEITFDQIYEFSQQCKFKDCTHIHEKGCAVLEALKHGEIDRVSYENYIKMTKEKAHFESTIMERRKKDKLFGKMLKNYKKDMNKNNN